jgi:hypothetical protein
VLVNPDNPTIVDSTLRDLEPAARAIGLQIQVVNASTIREINEAFTTLARERPMLFWSVSTPSSMAGVSNWFISRHAMGSQRRIPHGTLSKPVG